ncbi:UNVERIFIED_CONTAM: autotransporter-associated beta strand repeat-containing protein, partial [Spiribacter pallidus]
DSGAGLTKQGGGTLKLTANNTFTGDTTIEAGTLQIGDGGPAGALGSDSIKIGDGATLDIRRSDSYTLSGDITDTAGTPSTGGSVAIDSSGGTITLSGNNSYSGGTTVTAGVLKAGSDLTTDVSGTVTGGAFGLGKSAAGDGLITVAAGAELDLNSYTISNDLNLSGGGVNGGALNHSGSDKATVTGDITLAAAGTVIKSTGDLTLGGDLITGFPPAPGSPLTLEFDNAGRVDLASDLTLTTDTKIISGAGTLRLAGSIDDDADNATGSALTVENTGSLELLGAVGGSEAIDSLTVNGAAMVAADITTVG